ncbi:hypothetical protein GPECTOR_5g335 [Gonium pectorale]|uniref:Aminotransferase class V domain-containing protein n=1 Tax=Gonium pectorale TaxID=33097 RepID=A0A150GWR9_GONPE|nr:hypothetical protein GPECTOR_5g335 [Gonium pectorale]|eukprot:KXZ54245.1 hypothetical protein GPECTOR_5g335 [Gonium pectorale]
MGGLGDVVRHFGLKAVYVLVAYGVTRVVDAGKLRQLLRGRRKSAGGERERPVDARPAPPKPAAPRYRIYHNPRRDFQPSNPGWIREAADLDPADLATDLSWQCPQLIAFQAKLAGQAKLRQQPLPATPDAGRGAAGGDGEAGPAPPAHAPPAAAPPAGPGPGSISFGRQARKQLFALEPGVTYLNHGSYGAAFRLALDVRSWYQQQLEAQPVRFMETVALKGMVAAVADAARFVGASHRDVVPTVNATSAVCAVLRAVPLRRGDWVLTLNTTYSAVQLGLEELQWPASVLGAVQAALSAIGGGRRLRLAVLDHVVSFPPVVLPVAALTAACKQVGAQVLVDGAHAIGNVPRLQVPSIGADYYTANLHKWGCSPKGAALLWVAPERQEDLLPLTTSHGAGLGFRAEFLWQGTSDPSAWLAVPAALAVLRWLGPQHVAERNAALVAEAAAALRARWEARAAMGTGPNPAAAGELGRPPLSLLALGGGGDWAAGSGAAGMLAVQLPPLRGYEVSAGSAVRLQRWLREEKDIEVPVVCALGCLWVRISAQVYNEAADYEELGAAVEALQG